MKDFAQLFKKYRLRAEFETIARFSNAFAEMGYCYEESIFSHWQKGTRTPSKRPILISLITLFINRKSIRTFEEANEFLESAGQGYLTDSERLFLQTNFRQQASL